MIINNSINYNLFVNIENSRAINNKTPMFFQNELNDIASRKEFAGNDNSLQNCAISKEKIDDAVQNENDKIAESEEKAKDIFTICFECENKEECEHYQKMINGDENVEGNAVFLPKNKTSYKHKNEVKLQEQLYKLTGSSIIYNYNIICPDIDIKSKREKR